MYVWLKNRIVLLILLITASVSLYESNRWLAQKNKEAKEAYPLPPLSVLPPEVVSVIFLGHESLYQEFIGLWLIQALAEDPTTQDLPGLLRLLEHTLKHKPKVEMAYMLACFVVSNRHNAPEHCEGIIEKGLSVLPDHFRLLITQAFIFGFKLNQPLKASAYYYLAAVSKKTPPYVRNVAEKMAKKANFAEEDLQKTMEILLQSKNKEGLIEFLNNIKPQNQ